MKISAKISTLLMVPVAGAALSAFAGNGLVYGNVSGWTVLTDPERSYRCFAEVQYEGGSVVRIGFDSGTAGVYLDVADPAWRGLKAGGEHSAELNFDDQVQLSVNGAGLAQESPESSGLRLSIPADTRDAFVSDFMSRHTLTIKIEGLDPLTLSLAGSLRATRMLEDCQASMAGRGAGNGA